MKLLIYIVSLTLLSTSLIANKYNISEANALFKKHDFQQALQEYEKAMSEVHTSPDLYYNAGTTALRTEDYTKAMLYLERALKYDPSMENAEINKEITMNKIGDSYIHSPKSGIASFWNRIQFSMNSNQWLLCFFISSILATFLWSIQKKINPKIYSSLFLVFTSVAVLSLLCSLLNYNRSNNESYAIFKENKPDIYEAPGAKAQKLDIPAGQKCKILDKVENLDLVRLPNGVEFYVQKESLLPI